MSVLPNKSHVGVHGIISNKEDVHIPVTLKSVGPNYFQAVIDGSQQQMANGFLRDAWEFEPDRPKLPTKLFAVVQISSTKYCRYYEADNWVSENGRFYTGDYLLRNADESSITVLWEGIES